MKTVVKFVVMTSRWCKMNDIIVTSDGDVLYPIHGSITTIHQAYFSDAIGEDERKALKAISEIVNKETTEVVEFSPGSPWFDDTPYKRFPNYCLTHESLPILSAALPEYDFQPTTTEYDERILTRPLIRMNLSYFIETEERWESPGACADVMVDHEAVLIHHQWLRRIITLSEIPDKDTINLIKHKLASCNFVDSLYISLSQSYPTKEETGLLFENIVRELTMESDTLAFVVAEAPQNHTISFTSKKTVWSRIFGGHRLKYKLQFGTLP